MIRGCFKSPDAVNYCTCKLISFQVKKILEENLKSLLRVILKLKWIVEERTEATKADDDGHRSRTDKGRTYERKRKEAEKNENKKTDEVLEAAAAKTAIDQKESASAQFKQMRA